MRVSRWLVLPGLVACLFAYETLRSEPATPELPRFRDIAAQSGVRFRTECSPTSQKYLLETMGGGVAIFDYNGDGRMDLFLVNGAHLDDPMPSGKSPDKTPPRYWNRLYRNNGDGTFTDVTEQAGVRGTSYGMGVATGDYDNDGRVDLYVTGWGGNTLYHNNGDGTFTDVTAKAGVAGGGWSTSAAFVDYDRDGFLDLVVARYLAWDFSMNVWCGDRARGLRAFCHPDVFQPAQALVFHNNGHGGFEDVSLKSGIGASPGNGLGVAFGDYNHDGWPDIAIANDARPQQLFENSGQSGSFRETGLPGGMAFDDNGQTFSGMGIDFADYDNDGWPDLFITDLATQKYALFRNREAQFQYVSDDSGIAKVTLRHSGWGCGFADFDNDGWKDLFIAQGHVMDNIEQLQPGLAYLERPAILHNERGKFKDISELSGVPFQVSAAGRGVAIGDLDNDGFEDIVFTSLEGSVRILHNGGNRNHWITINAVGRTSNRDGIGTQMHAVTQSGAEQWAQVTSAGSYISAGDKRVHFGLGADTMLRSLDLVWPSGMKQRLTNLKANEILTISEPDRAGGAQ